MLTTMKNESGTRNVVAVQRGLALRCKGWMQEGILRMLENTVQNGEDPENLIIYGGQGKAARNWESYWALVESLKGLENDETLVVQSGKPVGIFKTRVESPRVIIANTHLVPKWATWENFRELEAKVWPLLTRREIGPVVHAALPLAEAAAAHRLEFRGRCRGP